MDRLREVIDKYRTPPKKEKRPKGPFPRNLYKTDKELIVRLRNEGRFVEAIKLIREITEWSLSDSKKYMEQL
jgi:ribosomal protein L7/L12